MKPMKQKEIKINLNEFNLKVVKSPKTDESFLMKSAWFIGKTAARIHQVIITVWFKILFAITAAWLLMHWTGISIGVFLNDGLLFRIK
jgi:hypothetical protein